MQSISMNNCGGKREKRERISPNRKKKKNFFQEKMNFSVKTSFRNLSVKSSISSSNHSIKNISNGVFRLKKSEFSQQAATTTSKATRTNLKNNLNSSVSSVSSSVSSPSSSSNYFSNFDKSIFSRKNTTTMTMTQQQQLQKNSLAPSLRQTTTSPSIFSTKKTTSLSSLFSNFVSQRSQTSTSSSTSFNNFFSGSTTMSISGALAATMNSSAGTASVTSRTALGLLLSFFWFLDGVYVNRFFFPSSFFFFSFSFFLVVVFAAL